MPGAIGDAYERYLWTTNLESGMTELKARSFVKRIGKPFQEVYDIALSQTLSGSGKLGGKVVDPSRAIMVGDAMETDILGGMNAGIDSLWVIKDGIHGEDVVDKGAIAVVEGFNGRSDADTYAYGKKVMPEYSVDHFQW